MIFKMDSKLNGFCIPEIEIPQPVLPFSSIQGQSWQNGFCLLTIIALKKERKILQVKGNQGPITTGSVMAKWVISNLVQTDRRRVKGISLGNMEGTN